jgi:hypothetical protein
MGAKFRRQQPIGKYIVDFYCAKYKLIIELDGGQHTSEKDAPREQSLINNGATILRFWNNDVLQNTEGVYMKIIATITALSITSPSPVAALPRHPLPHPHLSSPLKGEVKVGEGERESRTLPLSQRRNS